MRGDPHDRLADEAHAAAILAVLAVGVVAAFHVGKVPPSLPLIRAETGIGLVTAGWLVSLMQLAGAALAVLGGAIADRVGLRRAMLAGLGLLALGDLAGAAAPGIDGLLASRVLESFGLQLAVLPGPALLARLTPPARLRPVMGVWAAYMPAGMAITLLACAAWLPWVGWRGAWLACAVLAAGAIAGVLRWVPVATASRPSPADRSRRPSGAGAGSLPAPLRDALRDVLRSPGPWLLAAAFGCYSSQWIGVFTFLPTLYREQGVAPGTAGVLTAAGVAANVAGNVAAGALLQRGASRAVLLAVAAIAMIGGAWVALGTQAPLAVRFGAIVAFSALGGLIPGTLFASVPAFAPHARAMSTTAGLMMQGSAIGQMLSPPLLGAVATATGGWQHGWVVTGGFAACGLVVAARIARRDRRSRWPASGPAIHGRDDAGGTGSGGR